MNSELKTRWVAALRSGDYKQGTGQLRYGDAFCCLGVACDLAAKDDLGVWQSGEGAGMGIAGWYHNRFVTVEGPETGGLPIVLAERMGMDSYGVLPMQPRNPSNGTVMLTELNDNGMTFDQIADVIEHFL